MPAAGSIGRVSPPRRPPFFLIVWALIRIEGAQHRDLLQLLWPFAAGAALLGAFIRVELKTLEPLVDVHMFRIARFTGASVVVASLSAGLITAMFFLTLYLQAILRFSPLPAVMSIPAPMSQRGLTRVIALPAIGAVTATRNVLGNRRSPVCGSVVGVSRRPRSGGRFLPHFSQRLRRE